MCSCLIYTLCVQLFFLILMAAISLYCSLTDTKAENFLLSGPLRPAKRAQWLLDEPHVISINNGQRQWWPHSLILVLYCPSLLSLYPSSSSSSSSSSLSRLANILMLLSPGSLSTLPSADNADWQVKQCAAERGESDTAEGRERRRLFGFLLALMWAKQMNDIVIQGVKLKNKDTEEWKISDWRTVRIKAMPWIRFCVAERQATAWPWNYIIEVPHLVRIFLLM